MKYLKIKDFREKGYLQELNRRFLHQLGLAIEIKISDDGDEVISGIQDHRDDEEGIYYDIANSESDRKEVFKKKKEFIDNELKQRNLKRKENIGFTIEEVPNSVEVYGETFLSLAASFENYKKRIGKEKEDLASTIKIKMLTSILDIDNDISIAINYEVNEEAKDGLSLISRKVENFLKTHNIESINTDTYDEDLHEVVNIIPFEKDCVVSVISKGYTLNGKPFRYPKIILGKKN